MSVVLRGADGRGPSSERVVPALRLAVFPAGDGDWLVTWLIAYTVAAVVVLIAWPILHFTTNLTLMTEMTILVVLGALAVAILFPYCQGASAAILYFLRVRWRE